jgi:hypothetical protein
MIAAIGIDIGKNCFHVVSRDGRGAVALRQKWSRGQVEARLANMPACLIGMEARRGASSQPPLECCFGTSPIQAEKYRPDRKAFGSATLATRAVASAGPTPDISSSRLLVSLDRCQAMIWRSNSRIWAFSSRS